VTWIAIACGLAFAVLLYRHLMKMAQHTVLLSITGVLAVVPGWFAWRTHQLEERLADAVQEISGVADAEVDCQGFLREFRLDNNLGEVQFGRDGTPSQTAGLRASVCDHLSDWLDSDKSTPSEDQIVAVHVLTHEAMHVAGITDERSAECQAMQSDARMAESLGATPRQAQTLATRYAMQVYPRMPSGYTSPGCSEDGEYDLTPGDGVWP